MSTVKEKMEQQKPIVLDPVETDHENLKLSRDQFELKYRKKAEIKAKLALEKARLEELAEQEEKELEAVGSQDNNKTATEE